ncbi:hypothetical protein RB595_006933 [Gaeumannomyces hyphopodioides]
MASHAFLAVTPSMLSGYAALAAFGAACLAVLVLGARILISYLSSPLRVVPGPFLAGFTDVWRMLDYRRHSQTRSQQALHQKYGVAVRLGPNTVSLSDPALLRTIEYAAWDLAWSLTFSEDLGFLKTGADIDGMIKTGEMTMRYLGIVGQMPWLDMWLGKNPRCPVEFATFSNTLMYCVYRTIERGAERVSKGKGVAGGADRSDFLDNFLEAKELYPDTISDNEVVSYLMMNVLAGADTTSLVQKAITYHILKSPAVKARLVAELDGAGFTSSPPPYAETKDLPYLEAVIREGMRMHPVLGGVLERVVGMNLWVTSRDKQTFSDDADAFRPEGWLRGEQESEAHYSARFGRMRGADFTFGGGSRTCVGRHLAMMEIHKLTTTLFTRHDLSLVPAAETGRFAIGGSPSSTESMSESSVDEGSPRSG